RTSTPPPSDASINVGARDRRHSQALLYPIGPEPLGASTAPRRGSRPLQSAAKAIEKPVAMGTFLMLGRWPAGYSRSHAGGHQDTPVGGAPRSPEPRAANRAIPSPYQRAVRTPHRSSTGPSRAEEALGSTRSPADLLRSACAGAGRQT